MVIFVVKKIALTDVENLHRMARKHIGEGAVTAAYSAERSAVVKRLNEAPAAEILCILRYRSHQLMTCGIQAKSTADEFLVHSKEEQGHTDCIEAFPRVSGMKCRRQLGMICANFHSCIDELSKSVINLYGASPASTQIG